jgi:hypothetical protein
MLAFVPVVPPPPPSPRAEALGQRLAEAIEQYRQQNPDLSALELSQAVQLTLARTGGARAATPRLIAVIVGLVAALGLALALGLASRGAVNSMALVGVLILGLLVVMMVVRTAFRDR